MEIKEVEARIEAILFTMGEPVEANQLSIALETEIDDIRNIVRNMMIKYNEDNRGIKIIEVNDTYQLCTKPDMYEYIIKVAHTPKKPTLTDALLETLSIVAYKQPITKAEIASIRGVNCDHAVAKLMEYNLVCELGRLEQPGRPIALGTTDEFLRNFGLSSIEDLPIINPERIEDFKIEVQEELQLSLPI